MKKHLYLIISLILLVIGGIGCSLNNINQTAVGEEDLLAARRILAGSLSSDESGIILSLNDALTSVSENGFIAAAYQGDHSGRGNETNYSHSYRKKKGMHIITFKRKVQDALFSKTVKSSLHYQYRTSNGTSIKFPRQHARRIASIYYVSRREGRITTLHKKSHFVRQDTFLIRGLNTSTLKIDGVYHSSGTIKITPAKGSSFQRNYELEINLLNITASPAAFNNNRNFWKKVSGTLSWQLQISQKGHLKKMGGTIKLSGAGMAMLNFHGKAQTYKVNLNNGDLKDRDEEFEGRVTAVNLAEQSVVLFSGRTLYLNANSNIEHEAYLSLKAVSEAINQGIKVWTEGKGKIQDGRFIVAEIEFEKEKSEPDDDAEIRIEFDDTVSSVNVSAGVFTLFGKATIAINEKTRIDKEGDYVSLQAVAEALANGLQVSAEGEAISGKAGRADLVALEVEFQQVEPDNRNGEDDE